MSSENSSSPWNIAPVASTSPKAVSPWAVSPFQTSNPFKSPETSSSLIETEPEPDVLSLAVKQHVPATTKPTSVFSAAFEPTEEATEPVASSAWTVAPIAKTEETASASTWTSAAFDAVEHVKQKTLAPIKENIAPGVAEVVAEKMAAVEEEEESNVQTQGEGTTSAWTSVPVQKAAVSALDVVNEAAVVEKTEVVEESAVVAVSAPVESAEEILPVVVDEAVVLHKEEEEEEEEEEEALCADSATCTLASVEEATLSAWTSTPILDKVVPVVVKVEATVERPVAEEEVAEMEVETATVEAEVEADPVEEAPVETVSPWTAASVQEEAVEIVAPELAVETPETAAENPELVTVVRKHIEESPIEEDGRSTGAWNLTSVQEEIMMEAGSVKEGPIKEDEVELNEAPVEKIAAFVEAEKVVLATSSAWTTTPVQEVKADEIEKAKSIKEVKSVQEPSIVKEVTKEAPVVVVKDVCVATEDVVENGKVDKKAIADAFDGVVSYKVDSVSKMKKVPTIEATAAESADAPEACGACGVGGCSIQ